MEVAEGWSGIVGSFVSRSNSMQSVAAGVPCAQGALPCEPGMGKLTAASSKAISTAQPSFAAQAGRHEFDGQLPDFSNHGIRREIARLHDQRDQIAAVDPKTLEPRERFDREYLLAVVDRDLFWMEKAKFPFSNPGWYCDKIDPDMYLNRNYAPLRRAHEGVHQVRARHPEDGDGHQGQPAIAAAQDLRGIGNRAVRRIGRLLLEGRSRDFRFGERSGSAEAADRGGYGGGAGDGRSQALPGGRAQESERQVRAGRRTSTRRW